MEWARIKCEFIDIISFPVSWQNLKKFIPEKEQ
jgi:hypothetical protein